MSQVHTAASPVPAPTPRRKRRILKVLLWSILILLIVAVLSTFGVAYYIGWQLLHPVRAAVTETPQDAGLTYQDVTFPSQQDNLQLKGWFIPANGPTDKIVIFAHGFRGNRVKDAPALPTMKALHNQGFSVLAFDFRDEGQSAGKFVSVGYYEVRDLMGAVDFAESRGYKHVGVIGFSMGASTALQAAIRDNRIESVVSDSPFANLHDYLVTNMPSWTHLPNWPFTPELLWEIQVFNGLDANAVDPLGGLKTWTPRPLMLIAGTADDLIPMSNSQELYNVVKNNPADSLWIVPGAKHVGAYKVAPEQYEQKVTNFFLRTLK